MNALESPLPPAPRRSDRQPILRALHPGLVTDRFYDTWDFYTTHLGFRTVAERDTYVHLVHPEGPEIGILRHETDGQEAELICPSGGRGFWLEITVDDADATYARLWSEGVRVSHPPETLPGGERRFLIRDPNGVLIYLTQRPAGTA